MGKWDKLSRRGSTEPEEGGGRSMLLFGDFFFFICYSCESAKRKTGPSVEREAAFSQDRWRHICLKFFAIWQSELFPVVIKS